MRSKKILFVTGTRADFGKLKSLIRIVEQSVDLEAHLFVTGMHLLETYGLTVLEVERERCASIHTFINQQPGDPMDAALAKTISGLSEYVTQLQPDLIVVHGDRIEALAAAITGALNNTLVAHVEGGEVSGTIDEAIRHAITKFAHLHFVSNEASAKRIRQLGEPSDSIWIIGSPDLDLMTSRELPCIQDVQRYYEIPFTQYGIIMFHPVTTEINDLHKQVKQLMVGVIRSKKSFVVVYPNNDLGSEIIIDQYEQLKNRENFRVFPSLRFEYFLTLMKSSQIVVGNSSAGVREAPFYGIPTVNVGSRQTGRAFSPSIVNVKPISTQITRAILENWEQTYEPVIEFGAGNSSELFLSALRQREFWTKPKQKRFVDL